MWKMSPQLDSKKLPYCLMLRGYIIYGVAKQNNKKNQISKLKIEDASYPDFHACIVNCYKLLIVFNTRYARTHRIDECSQCCRCC